MGTPPIDALIAPDGPKAREHSLRRAGYLTVGVGFAHALLFLLSFWLLFDSTGAAMSGTGTDNTYRRRLTLAGLYLMPFAGIAFVWFMVALRMWISSHGRPENILHANIQLVSGILYVGLFFAAGAAAATAAASAEFEGAQIAPTNTGQFPRYGSTLLFVFAVRMAAMFVFSTTTVARSTGALPRWFNVAGFVVGLFLLLSATFSRVLVIVFPVWMLLLCALLLIRARQIPAGAVMQAPSVQPAVLGHGGGE